MAANYWGDNDAWDQPQRGRMPAGGFLDPGYGPQYRSRSSGAPQAPQINVYNRVETDRHDQDHPPYPPIPPARSPPRATSRHDHHHYRLGNDLVEDLADLELERRQRSRSRGRSDVNAFDKQAAYNEWKLQEAQDQLKEASRRAEWEREERRIRDELKYKYAHDDEIARLERQKADDQFKTKMLEAEAKARRDKEAADQRERLWEEEYQRKQREKKDKAKDEERRIKDQIERDERDAKEKERAMLREIELKKQAEKEKEERMWHELELKKQAEKDKKEAELKEAERIIHEREEKKKKDAKAAEEKFQEEMRHRLRDLGYTEQTIEIMVDKEKAEKFKHQVEDQGRSDALNVYRAPKNPIYPKIHRDYLAVETLQHYDLPWEYDRVSTAGLDEPRLLC